MELLRPSRRALAGVVVGAACAVAAVLLGDIMGDVAPHTVLLVTAIAIVGLLLGSSAAFYAYLAGAAALVLLSLRPMPAAEISLDESLRLATFLVGAPVLVLLVQRGERALRVARDAQRTAEDAERRTEQERVALEEARATVDLALQAAERERARLEEVAEAIPEPLIVYDSELRGTYGNRAALRLLGRSFFERPIEEWARAAEPRDGQGRPLPREQWPQLRAQMEPVRLRMTARVPMSGRDVIVDVEGTPVPGGGCLLLLRDVGREEEQRRRLSQFASFVAHELRNPLAVAKARIELAHRDPDLSQRAGAHAQRALDSVDAAIGILERLELYSRADTGRIEARREPFQLRAAVAAAAERLRARGSDRPLEVDVPPSLSVLGDRQLSEQAITNLLTNADRYSDAGTGISVVAADGDPVKLRVIDAGPGIDDDVAERLFRDRVTSGRGLGLGLYLVRAVMEAQGGSVELSERRPRAVFTLRWPAAEELPATTGPETRPAAASPDGRRPGRPAAEASTGERSPARRRRR
ncbi:MAG TPA: PAS domain-containing sensor histidine kinase [Candidatus Limnocylindria bacterium]|nr:PAS domain-containing sensor histidine kinase [Candidatus Limnocylindria bacterium]